LAFEIVYKKSVKRDLAHLAKADARRILDKIEKELATRPTACAALTGQFAGLRRLRVGPYRVIFAVLDKQVLVLRIGHRREVYDP
jgi:mRNA interferase RelE/StbE